MNIEDIKNLSYKEKLLLAENTNTSTEILNFLVMDEHWQIKMAVVKNPNVSIEVFETLAKNEDENVRSIIIENLNYNNFKKERIDNIFKKLVNFEDVSAYTVTKLLKNPNTPIEIFEILAKNKNVNSFLAENLNYNHCKTKKEREQITNIFYILANSKENWSHYNAITDSLLKNPNTPIEILKNFAVDNRKWVVDIIAIHPKAQEIFNIILDDYSKTNFSEIMDINIDSLRKYKPSFGLDKLYNCLKYAKEKGLEIKPSLDNTRKVQIGNN